MKTQIKLTVQDSLAKTFKQTAKDLGYLSTQEFIVESARKRALAIAGLKALQGSMKGEPKKLTEQDYEELLKIDSDELFRKFNLNRVPNARKVR